MFFEYGEKEIACLKSKDKTLGAAIDAIGHIERTVDTDLFSSIIRHIIGQQISAAAQKTIWERITRKIGAITADAVNGLSVDEIQQFGTTFRKAAYIKDFARKIESGKFAPDDMRGKSDSEIVARLSAVKGIGVWTAEMILIFCLQRPDIFSYTDLAIHRGLRMLYRHETIDKQKFEQYRLAFSPHCTVASLYIWAVAGRALGGMKEYAPKKKPVSGA
ncbi:DNA-3-methyladenine glycosylase family protein [Treponema endosymbiont of Eucomonympha sp.]|uniref:DNA-3-methyladenine glycosylase family protein n=1 Tax=Treponema endosymbiont of Eucomonympha sp. TaxID=1580831 RepID=UPI0007515305|nr:DNA-3-methyladenine glycosylase 2 family protein [Treponema endosymbiont of Eucomonympha sp.]